MKMEDPQTYVFISRSGGGKGTQIDLLQEYFQKSSIGEVLTLEAGQRFREFIASGSYSAKIASKYNEKGLLQPSFLSVWAWGGFLTRNLDGHHHLFVDGTPRKINEAYIFVEAMDFYNRKNVKIIYLNISREEAEKRMLARKRFDDSKESIKTRLDWFETNVLPVIDFFREKEDYEVIEVRGERAPGDVHNEILTRLGI